MRGSIHKCPKCRRMVVTGTVTLSEKPTTCPGCDTVQLRADLARVTEERDALREQRDAAVALLERALPEVGLEVSTKDEARRQRQLESDITAHLARLKDSGEGP